MIRRALASFAAAIACLTISATTSAQSFRCKNDLVTLGDSRASVLLKCGEPVVKDSVCKPLPPQTVPSAESGSTVVNAASCVTVDEWTYNPGVGQLMTTLHFESGALTAIRYGDRVQ